MSRDDAQGNGKTAEPNEPPRALSPAAQRALVEAEARRKAYEAQEKAMPRELGGRKKGREPARYGDWELKGIAVDF